MQWEWERLRKVPLFTAPDPLNTSAHPCMWEDQLLSYRGGREGGRGSRTHGAKETDRDKSQAACNSRPTSRAIDRAIGNWSCRREAFTYVRVVSLSLSLSLSAFFYDAKSEVLTFDFVVTHSRYSYFTTSQPHPCLKCNNMTVNVFNLTLCSMEVDSLCITAVGGDIPVFGRFSCGLSGPLRWYGRRRGGGGGNGQTMLRAPRRYQRADKNASPPPLSPLPSLAASLSFVKRAPSVAPFSV